MSENSAIEWTHHTFNPWWGCTKVSPACTHCYAETWSKRLALKLWGNQAPRRFFGDSYWRQPLKWNLKAERLGQRQRVFCASMADVFEHREDLRIWRERLWGLIANTPWLDWLLLTKRPENASTIVPWGSVWPTNVWLGATVENQEWAEKRVPVLLSAPAVVHFVSCEPLLGPLDLSSWLVERRSARSSTIRRSSSTKIDWVIAGGESGHHARPTNPVWVRALRDQCRRESSAFHFKQWGDWAPVPVRRPGEKRPLIVGAASVPDEPMERLGKKEAGRTLDGRTWDEFPDMSPDVGSAIGESRRLLRAGTG
jgi:protein gp37